MNEKYSKRLTLKIGLHLHITCLITAGPKHSILDFKLLPYSVCCMLSSGLFPGVWSLYSNVLEHSVPTS